ncbi:MAG: hypothetical protein AAFU85_34515 [Planctomycetota bacterium]
MANPIRSVAPAVCLALIGADNINVKGDPMRLSNTHLRIPANT